ncbi:MAG: acetyl-CoA carboxylase biotin carboxyl carrier protein [Cytophagaceae bacterium]|nr:acetyl-CoA carboxylase biotin carboxyl carrier protein [Cytophagaceae bacterium]
METKEIQKLLDFIAHSGLDEVSIETSELKISVKRYGGTVSAAPVAASMPVATAPALTPAAVQPVSPVASPITPPALPSNVITVRSPMIGTFYRSSGPESPLMVEIGDEIKPGKVLCIIEAMKLFNEIESEVSGKIIKILVENATPVEFDQPLFLVELV